MSQPTSDESISNAKPKKTKYTEYLEELLESMVAHKNASGYSVGARWAFIRLALGKGNSGYPLPTGVREVAEAAVRSGAGEAFANLHGAAAKGILELAKEARHSGANPGTEG